MTRRSTSPDTRALFGAKFSDQFKKWKKEEKGRTMTSFGKLFGATRQTVGNWCTGDDIPTPARLKKICEEFGVPDDYFDTDNMTHDEKYKYSSVYQTEVGRKHVEFSTKQLGLDLNLVQALSDLVDFDKLFPLYSPIEHTTRDPDTGEVVYDRRVNFPNSAHMETVDKDLRFLQIERDGKRITLHRCDLAFLKEVQDQVKDYVEYLFYHRSKEMDEETVKFNEDLVEVTVDGVPVSGSQRDHFLKKSGLHRRREIQEEFSHFTEEEIEAFKKKRDEIFASGNSGSNVQIKYKVATSKFVREHDRFAKYCYVFDDQPTPDWVSIYEEEPRPEEPPRDATQEDIDQFFSPRKGEREVNLVGGGKGIVKEGK